MKPRPKPISTNLPADLTLSEASLLAGIPQQPTNFNPALYPENAHRRQDYVLDQMVKLGYITRAQANEAYANWPTVYQTREGDGGVLDHPHFVQYVHEYLAEKFPDRDFTKGGFNIYTTIDTDLQVRAEEIVAQNVEQLQYYNAHNAALTIVIPWSGEILAMVGSADFNNASIEGQVNITTSAQQPGSAIKPIVYAAALRAGLDPGHRRPRCPDQDRYARARTPATGEPVPYYEPQNYMRNFNGAVTGADGPGQLAQYSGHQGGRVLRRRGSDRRRWPASMGIKHELSQPPADYGLSIGLGSGDVWPLELTNAYATIANDGQVRPGHADPEDH